MGSCLGTKPSSSPFTTGYVSSASTSLAKLTGQSRTSPAGPAGPARPATATEETNASRPARRIHRRGRPRCPRRSAPSSTTSVRWASGDSSPNDSMTASTTGLRPLPEELEETKDADNPPSTQPHAAPRMTLPVRPTKSVRPRGVARTPGRARGRTRRPPDSDHLAVVAQVEHEIARLSRKLGFDRPSGGGDGR